MMDDVVARYLCKHHSSTLRCLIPMMKRIIVEIETMKAGNHILSAMNYSLARSLNSNQAYIAEKLNSVGIFGDKMTTIGDDEDEILSLHFRRHTPLTMLLPSPGGLGPTHDDIHAARR